MIAGGLAHEAEDVVTEVGTRPREHGLLMAGSGCGRATFIHHYVSFPFSLVDGDRVIGGVSGDAHERALDHGEHDGHGRIIVRLLS